MINRLFTEHPQSVGESYFAHMGMAFRFGTRLLIVAIACLLHGILPFLFVKTGSNAIEELHDVMVTNRVRKGAKSRASSQNYA